MASRAARVALALCLLHGAPIAAQDVKPPGTVSATSEWALEVLTFEVPAPTALWAGLINRASEARLVCILDRGIADNEKDGTFEGGNRRRIAARW